MVANLLPFFVEEHFGKRLLWPQTAASASLGGEDVSCNRHGGPEQGAQAKDRDGEEHPHACLKNNKPAVEETARIATGGVLIVRAAPHC